MNASQDLPARVAIRCAPELAPLILCELRSEQSRKQLLVEFAKAGYACTRCDENHILALPP